MTHNTIFMCIFTFFIWYILVHVEAGNQCIIYLRWLLYKQWIIKKEMITLTSFFPWISPWKYVFPSLETFLKLTGFSSIIYLILLRYGFGKKTLIKNHSVINCITVYEAIDVCFCVWYCTWKKKWTYVVVATTRTLLQIWPPLGFTIALLLCDSMCMTLWYHAKKLSYFGKVAFFSRKWPCQTSHVAYLWKNARGSS